MVELSLEQAQRIILEKQALVTKNPPTSIKEVAQRIHNIQIDTISVVARSHDLTLFNRYKQYQEKDVWTSLKKKELFESYSHALCLMPIEEYPFYKWAVDSYRKKKKTLSWEKWLASNQKAINFVLKRIQKEGALSSKDFKAENHKSQGWFDWKEEKIALEHLFQSGQLMISHREGFQKYYDIPERVLPASISSEPISYEEIPDYLIDTILQSLGICDYLEIKHYFKNSRAVKLLWKSNPKLITQFLDEKVSEGILEPVKVEGLERIQYIKSIEYDSLLKYINNDSKEIRLLSPFDNIARDRELMRKFWNYDYKIETYTPINDRKYGYYLMPILFGHQLVGRLDPKAHRKESILEIKGIYLEDWFSPDDDFYQQLAVYLKDFAKFHNCSHITLNDNNDTVLKKQISSYLD